MSQVIDSVVKWKKIRNTISSSNIGFVATMGCLHEGHKELILESKKNHTTTVVSIFINPHQFNNNQDLVTYPQTLEEDLVFLNDLKVDYVITPDKKMIYPDNYKFQVIEKNISQTVEGKHRPGFFEGILTAVLKLLVITRPEVAYFGEKDFEQYELIKEMAKAFLLDCKIQKVKTRREPSGLAYSSRNKNLTHSEKELASNIYYYLKNEKNPDKIKVELKNLGIKVEYICDHNQRRYIAAHINKTRLIDNIAVNNI